MQDSKSAEMLERKVEKRLVDRVERLGGKAPKFSSPGTTGMPDRLVILPNKIVFVETKRPKGGVLSARQRLVHKQLLALGHPVRTLNTYELIDDFIAEMQKELANEI